MNNELYQLIYNSSSFMFEMYNGKILPKDHPDYYDDLIEIKVIKKYDNVNGHITIWKEEYQITNEFVDSIFNYVELNINKLIEMSLKQNSEAEEYTSGGGLKINIKYKSIFISMDEKYTSIMNEQEQNAFYIFKQDIIKTIKNLLNANK